MPCTRTTSPPWLPRGRTRWKPEPSTKSSTASGAPMASTGGSSYADGHFENTENRVVRWYVLLTDIDERKQVEESLRLSEAFLLEAQSLSHTGSWRHNLVTGELTVSAEGMRLHGVLPDLKPGSIEFFFESRPSTDARGSRHEYDEGPGRRGSTTSPSTIGSCLATARSSTCTRSVIRSRAHGRGAGIHRDGDRDHRAGGSAIELEEAFEEIKRLKDRLQDENLALREEVVLAWMVEEIVGASTTLQATLASIADA